MSQANAPLANGGATAATPRTRSSTCKRRKTEAEVTNKCISDNSHLGGSTHSPQSSDLAFVCCGLEFKVHKAVVVPHSSVIRAAVQGRFLEAQTNVIDMDSFQPHTVRQLVDFMYMGDYAEPPEQATLPLPVPSGGAPTMPGATTAVPVVLIAAQGQRDGKPASRRIREHVHVNSIADYYGIPALEKLANDRIRTIVQSVPAERDRFWFHDLLPLVREALQMTGDKELFAVFAQGVVKYPDYFGAPDQIRELEALPGFCAQVVRTYAHLVPKIREEITKVVRDLAGQKAQYVRGMSAKGQILMDHESVITRHRAALATLNRTDHCAKCSAEFPCTINPAQGCLRCLRCDHEHGD